MAYNSQDEIKKTIGKRIVERSEKTTLLDSEGNPRKCTIDNLIEALQAEDVFVDSNTVKKWRNGTNAIKYSTLFTLADILDCDVDYLLGIQDLPHKDDTDIHAATGLSEEACEALKRCRSFNENPAFTDWFIIVALPTIVGIFEDLYTMSTNINREYKALPRAIRKMSNINDPLHDIDETLIHELSKYDIDQLEKIDKQVDTFVQLTNADTNADQNSNYVTDILNVLSISLPDTKVSIIREIYSKVIETVDRYKSLRLEQDKLLYSINMTIREAILLYLDEIYTMKEGDEK